MVIHFNREWTQMDANRDGAGGSSLQLGTDSVVGMSPAKLSRIISIDSREFASIRGSPTESFRLRGGHLAGSNGIGPAPPGETPGSAAGETPAATPTAPRLSPEDRAEPIAGEAQWLMQKSIAINSRHLLFDFDKSQ